MTSIDGVKDPRTAGVDYVRGRLVCVLAGEIAERRWCDEQGRKFRAGPCAGDRRIYRSVHRRSRLRLRSEDIRQETTALVTAHWNTIVAAAPQLARDGFVAPDTLQALADLAGVADLRRID
ncbi:hypothetical protein [Amycolatopsis sp. NPDC004079]|uniref:hypothetical protein n=1 Tax=Amycolatopsis sp. NPDC004079 TaxID=3154549 RepID=UPI0033BE3319